MKLAYSWIHRADIEFQHNCMSSECYHLMCLQGGSIEPSNELSLHYHEIFIANSIVDTGEMLDLYDSNNEHNLAVLHSLLLVQ